MVFTLYKTLSYTILFNTQNISVRNVITSQLIHVL